MIFIIILQLNALEKDSSSLLTVSHSMLHVQIPILHHCVMLQDVFAKWDRCLMKKIELVLTLQIVVSSIYSGLGPCILTIQ